MRKRRVTDKQSKKCRKIGVRSYANDSFHNFKEITKTLANPVFTRVFLIFFTKVAKNI